jgi:predicted amidohydrolase
VTRIGVASVPLTSRLADAVDAATVAIQQAAVLGADIIYLPEACLPGHRLQPDVIPRYPQEALDEALAAVAAVARRHRVATIVGTERVTPAGVQIVSTVVDGAGQVIGHQVKTQIDPAEEAFYIPGRGRSVFTIASVTFGISICHEGFRYPETVRWAARAGAQVVFHPHFVGDNTENSQPEQWCDPANSYNEKAVLCRAVENTVYMASCNYALTNQRSATCLIDPDGRLIAQLPYGQAAALVHEIDLTRATRQMALRYAPDRITAV